MTESIPSVQMSINDVLFLIFVASVLLSIIMGLTKKAVFYADYNDMLISLSVIAVPVMLMLLVGTVASFLPDYAQAALIIIPSLLLLFALIRNTYLSNNKNIFLTSILVASKLTLSFLYILYIVQVLMAKSRKERGFAALMLIFLTPLMIALVADREEGRNPLTTRGFKFW